MIRLKKKNIKYYAYSIFVTTLLISNLILWPPYLEGLETYAIMNGDDPVCYVKGKDTATEVVNELIEKDDNKSIKAVSSNFNIVKEGKNKDTVSKEEAVEKVKKVSEIKVASVDVEEKEYTPKTTYKKDDSMLAGQKEVISEGEEGKKEVTTLNVSVNGEEQSQKEICSEVLEEGKSEVVKKGTRGLPDGENWEEYDGLPVYKSGDDIAETAKTYIGKVQYVWGGKDLEKGVDCSGFIIALYRLYGVNLTYPLYKQGVEVPYSEARPGDILYFPGHYGMYIGNGKMVHASNPRTDVCIGDVAGRKLLCVTRVIPE